MISWEQFFNILHQTFSLPNRKSTQVGVPLTHHSNGRIFSPSLFPFKTKNGITSRHEPALLPRRPDQRKRRILNLSSLVVKEYLLRDSFSLLLHGFLFEVTRCILSYNFKALKCPSRLKNLMKKE